MSVKLKLFFKQLVYLLSFRKCIIFESVPDYSDNTKAVFDEMLRRGLNKKYKLVWIIYDSDINSYPKIHNVYYVSHTDKLKYQYYSASAKAFISCNRFLEKYIDNKQKDFFLAHGTALKNCRNHYNLPKYVDEVMSLSPYIAEYDAINYQCSVEKMNPLGFARNDELFGDKIDLKSIFTDSDFEKAIYWMPTYRQHRLGGGAHSNISFPIIYNEEIANEINASAKKNNVLLILKPHPAQDLSRIKTLKLSNLVFIDNSFFKENNISNYSLLRSVDAMVTDYSSVYYDYLLCDKPIGLCFDDFEEYKQREGFTVDVDYILSGGEKIYNKDDFCKFIEKISRGEDVLPDERREIRDLIHLHADNKSSQRIVDHISEYL